MPDLSMLIPITKVDAAQRLVYGVATAEVEDRAGEICDYASTRPNYEKWSEAIARSTKGKSLGNLRAMHGPVAAGKVTAITFNDEAKQIEICAKVVDDAEWVKVTEGVYTGFSQGGTYARRWTDEAGLTRYTAVPTEISLVDLPCLPQACFEMIKADGSREWRRFGHGMDASTRIARLIEELDWLCEAGILEEAAGGTHQEAVEELPGLVERATTILRQILSEQSAEHPRRERARPAPMKMAAGLQAASAHAGVALAKADPSDEDTDQARVQRLHDTSVELGASCGAKKLAQGGLEKQFDKIAATLADVLDRVKKIEEQPLPLPFSGRPRAIPKHDDLGGDQSFGASIEGLLTDPDALSVLAIKLAQRNGRASNR